MPDRAGDARPLSYSDAGVDIERGDAFVDAIAPLAKATAVPGVMSGIGGFAALFDLAKLGMDDPILVSGTDGVGTKLLLAIEAGAERPELYEGLGQDLVAMCVNDVLCQGARPLFFLDYFATGRLTGAVAEAVVGGVAEACRLAGCALVGGETAEMPGLYADGHFDLAGFCVGAVERSALLPRLDAVAAGDVVIGVASSGVHSNGFSLVRRVVERTGLAWSDPAPFSNRTLAEALLEPTRLYVTPTLAALPKVKALAHITGGGLASNLLRVLPDGLAAEIDGAAWDLPPVFDWLMEEGPVTRDEALKTFNMGLGLCLVVSPNDAAAVRAAYADHGMETFEIGRMVTSDKKEVRVS